MNLRYASPTACLFTNEGLKLALDFFVAESCRSRPADLLGVGRICFLDRHLVVTAPEERLAQPLAAIINFRNDWIFLDRTFVLDCAGEPGQ